MKKSFILYLLAAILAGCAGSENAMKQPGPTTDTETLLGYQDEITVDFLKSHLAAFAHDSMQGREAGTPSEDKAARYLADQYREMGLKPMGDNGTYLQKFKLNATVSDSIVFDVFKTDKKNKLISHSIASKNNSAEFIRQFGGNSELKGDIIFAGYGINDRSGSINNFSDTDLSDKWVMVFQEIPHVIDGDTVVSQSYSTRSRFQTIMSQGAKGILVIPNASQEQFEEMANASSSQFGEAGNLRLAYRDTADSESGGFNGGYNLIDPALASQLLELESADALEGYRNKMAENMTSFKAHTLPYMLSQTPYNTKKTLESQNVLAYLEGVDPQLKDEVVVMTSHYDHLGVGRPDSTGDRIYNGADDDGSGTIGVLTSAHAFAIAKENGVGPKRSILFLNVTAEEKGLLGSRYYSDHPVIPMKQTVADINTDMIGRVDPQHKKKGIEEYAYIIGGDIISSQLDSLLNAANNKAGNIELSDRYNDLQDPNQFYRRSDHWNFGRKSVPFVFFFTGVHEDYHRPSDEVSKIRFDKMSKIVRTIYATAVLVANSENAPEVDNQEFIEITKSDN